MPHCHKFFVPPHHTTPMHVGSKLPAKTELETVAANKPLQAAAGVNKMQADSTKAVTSLITTTTITTSTTAPVLGLPSSDAVKSIVTKQLVSLVSYSSEDSDSDVDL